MIHIIGYLIIFLTIPTVIGLVDLYYKQEFLEGFMFGIVEEIILIIVGIVLFFGYYLIHK